jgi:DNA-binding NarL/FixJ family response regulator
MTRVLVAASSPVSRAGLQALVQSGGNAVAGSTTPGEIVELAADLHPDAILWQLSADEDVGLTLRSLIDQNTILVSSHAAFDLIRAGARGVLPLDVSAAQIGAALDAVSSGLGVFSPEHLDSAPGHTQKNSVSALTAREQEVLRLIAEGLPNKEIAWRLGISEHTVKFHVSALLGKLGAASRAEAISAGIRQGAIML